MRAPLEQLPSRTMVEQDDLKVVRAARVEGPRADEDVALVRVGVEDWGSREHPEHQQRWGTVPQGGKEHTAVEVDHLREDLEQATFARVSRSRSARQAKTITKRTLDSSFETRLRSMLCSARYSRLSTRAPLMSAEGEPAGVSDSSRR